MKLLFDILPKNYIVKTINADNKVIEKISLDSRNIGENYLFIAIKGYSSDGHEYIEMAIKKGATVIVCEILPSKLDNNITYILTNDAQNLLSVLASNFYNNPSDKLKIIGITGTNGKTSIATLLFNLFKNLGYKVGLISTIKNYIHDIELNSTHTTPDNIQLNKLFNEMVEYGCEYCFMEVSSHAIAQKRIANVNFVGGVFTNITHDHLDYHKTFEEYLKTKKSFFDNINENAFCLSNFDDKNGAVMLQNTKATKKFYSVKSIADFKGKIIEHDFDGLLLKINENEVWCKLLGTFNAYNLLAVYGTAILLNQDKIEVLKFLSNLSPVEGRFEIVKSKNNIIGIIDYAHTPDAIRNVLNTINEIRTRNEILITVIGCGGNRDKLKRPIMADISCELSDKVILTADNPRNESIESIINEMESGINGIYYYKSLKINDRKEAIKTAVSMAKENDIILIAGKGHENYQEIDGIQHHFDDVEVLQEIYKLFNI